MITYSRNTGNCMCCGTKQFCHICYWLNAADTFYHYCVGKLFGFFFSQSHKMAWPFLEPVNADDVPEYYDVINDPIGKAIFEK